MLSLDPIAFFWKLFFDGRFFLSTTPKGLARSDSFPQGGRRNSPRELDPTRPRREKNLHQHSYLARRR
jgi:hypothetical protein